MKIIARVAGGVRQLAVAARAMVGVQDYPRYVQHMREHHPELPVLDEGAYLALMQQQRFGGGKVGKCPC